MKAHTVILLIAAIVVPLLTSADSRTTRKKLKRTTETSDTLSLAKSPTPCTICDSVIFINYDKPLRSTKETFFIENRSSRTLTTVIIALIYRQTDGTMLHSRELTLRCAIPPGERRQLVHTSWDLQLAYYYVNTRVTPRSKKAIPFTVDATVVRATAE